MDDKIVDKIQKLLNIHNHPNTSREEAEAALLRAREMMMKYNIKIKEAEVQEEKDVYTRSFELNRRVPGYIHSISNVLQEFFNIKLLIHTEYFKNRRKGRKRIKNKRIDIIGFQEDVDSFYVIYAYTLEHYIRSVKKFVKTVDSFDRWYTEALKNDFLSGFCGGLREKFEEQNRKFEVMLYTDVKVIEYYNQLVAPGNGGKRTVRSAGNDDAYQEGFRRGKQGTEIRIDGWKLFLH